MKKNEFKYAVEADSIQRLASKKENVDFAIFLFIVSLIWGAVLILTLRAKPAKKIEPKVEPKPTSQVEIANVPRGTIREVSMYTSRKQETDNSPCISADGTNICKVKYNVCASNAFPLGTKLYVEGLGECIVKDRMNRRYKNAVDWYAGMDLQRALRFGRRKLLVVELKTN